jgi:hypothetical protein
MKFHIEFTYQAEQRENLLNYLHTGALTIEGPVKVLGVWVAL